MEAELLALRCRGQVVPGRAHHITLRGSRRRRVFFLDQDRRLFLRLLGGHARRAGLVLHAWCLMDNHIHLVATPMREEAVARTLEQVGAAHAWHLRQRARLKGAVWERTFAARPVSGWAFLLAARYVERNPVRAGLVALPEEYPWSSARAHCGLEPDPILPAGHTLADRFWRWREWLARPGRESRR